MADHWLSIVEYARETGISDMTIRRRIRTGRISAELRDGKYFIPVARDESSGQVVAVKSNVRATATTHVNQIMKSHPVPDRVLHRGMPTVQRAHPGAADSSQVMQSHPGIHNPVVSTDSSYQVSARVVGPTSAPGFLPDPGVVPETLARPLVEAGMASVEARGLIEFCHRALEQAKSTVASVEARYASRLDALNSKLAQKDQEIKSLSQQIEDLQLLVQILERKK